MKRLLIRVDGMEPLIYLTTSTYSFHTLYYMQKHVQNQSNMTEKMERNVRLLFSLLD